MVEKIGHFDTCSNYSRYKANGRSVPDAFPKTNQDLTLFYCKHQSCRTRKHRVSLELNFKTLVLAQIRESNFSTPTKQSINLAISKRHNKIKLAAARL